MPDGLGCWRFVQHGSSVCILTRERGNEKSLFPLPDGAYCPVRIVLLHGHNSVGSPCYHSASPWRNNEALIDSIYIGRRFKNDTERLEKLFQMYTEMTTAERKKPRA